jgi:EAL domain-containing protein (putative c-di-GMP-specific phosphodiesterase class I)/CheY-like chemotaxis protein
METRASIEESRPVTFGRRKVIPRACIVDSKRHIRTFLRHALEEFGFLACECDQVDQFVRVLDQTFPDLIMLSASDGEARRYLAVLAARAFDGRILLFGPPSSPLVVAHVELGAQLGLSTLPMLSTPFSADDLQARVAPLRPAHAPPNPPVDVGEALKADWLELWYQPKIDTRSLSVEGAEALVRLRHPTWGVVAPACFVPDAGDPHFVALSDFVIGRALEDWRSFVSHYGRVDIAINLPSAYFEDAAAIARLGLQMPTHPAFEGLIVEMNGADIVANLEHAREIARQLRFANIGISIDDLGAGWPALLALDDFPFMEIKVDREFVHGCATDGLKRAVCRDILELADQVGVRTVAEGVERQEDFAVVRDLGFDLVQGFLFAKPRPALEFARHALQRPLVLPS